MTVEHLRAYLDRLGPLLARQELLESRLERLNDQKLAPSRANLDGMPHSPSPADRTARLAIGITDTEARLAELSEQIERIRDEIAAILDLMPPATKRNHALQEAALWGRYMEGFSVREIAQSLYGKRPDYKDREEGYMRQSTRQVLEGLRRLAPLLPDELL